MKKIINNPLDVVNEMLLGLVESDPTLSYLTEHNVVYRKNKSVKVGLVSGGGSGHEPTHGGYVGKGMLDVAVAGNVFASPAPLAILAGIREANNGLGVILIVKNYSGDIMNFEMAKDLAEAEGIAVEMVVVHDDVATKDIKNTTGRRGIAGTILVHKITGAKAESGASLAETKAIAEKTIHNIRTMGMALSSCILPAVGTPIFKLNENEIEIGMGIHGEPGIHRTELLTSAELANILVERIFLDMDFNDSEVAVLVNGLGATPLMELFILYHDVHTILTKNNIKIHRSFVGNYMTSLEMAGCSLTLLKLDDELKQLLDATCDTPALKIMNLR